MIKHKTIKGSNVVRCQQLHASNLLRAAELQSDTNNLDNNSKRENQIDSPSLIHYIRLRPSSRPRYTSISNHLQYVAQMPVTRCGLSKCLGDGIFHHLYLVSIGVQETMSLCLLRMNKCAIDCNLKIASDTLVLVGLDLHWFVRKSLLNKFLCSPEFGGIASSTTPLYGDSYFVCLLSGGCCVGVCCWCGHGVL